MASELGCSVIAAAPGAFFNANALLDHVLGEDKGAFRKRLHGFLEDPEVIGLCELMTRRFLAYLSPAVTSSWFVVLERTPAHEAFRMPFEGVEIDGEAQGSREGLATCLGQSLGPRCGVYTRELNRASRMGASSEFLAFLETELLPRWPMASLNWRGYSHRRV